MHTCALDTDPNGLDGLMTGCVYIIVGCVIMDIEGNCGGYTQSSFEKHAYHFKIKVSVSKCSTVILL